MATSLGLLLVLTTVITVDNHTDLWLESAWRTALKSDPSPAPALNSKDLAAKGYYLLKAGNCLACHTDRGGPKGAGGRAIETPFGKVYSSNLTPDPRDGLGQWSAQDFWRALHHGKSKDGRLLTPAFPYKHSTLISRDDSNALFAALQTLEPVQNELPIAKPSQSLRWPFASAPALAIWRSLFFKPGTYQDDPTQSKDWNRGAYLVQGLGHCAACHSPRNAWGAWGEVDDLSGGWMQGVNWFAPSLLDDSSTGLASSSLASIVQLLQTGVHDQAQVSGPMAEVVQQSTQHMSEADLMAMALYLQSRAKAYAAVKPPVPLPSLNSSPSLATMSKPNFLSMGRSIYENQCEQCHGANGQGIQGAYPALSRNRAVLLQDPTNLVQSVLYGGYPPATLGNPRPFGMPPFILTLQDKEIAAVLTYIRSQWGNQATEVTPLHVHRVRALQGH